MNGSFSSFPAKVSLFTANIAQKGHGRSSLKGGAISLAARMINAILQIGTVILLARMLTPEDYGLVAMVTAITGFAPVFVDLGTRDAVVQRENISEGEVSALFWITLVVGGICCALVLAAAPLISKFYSEPRLSSIAFVSALTFVTSALTCQHQALLRRSMRFQEVAIVEVSAN